jgi:hypothetical protein
MGNSQGRKEFVKLRQRLGVMRVDGWLLPAGYTIDGPGGPYAVKKTRTWGSVACVDEVRSIR